MFCALCAELGGAKAVLQEEGEEEEDYSTRSGSSWMMGGSQKSFRGITSRKSMKENGAPGCGALKQTPDSPCSQSCHACLGSVLLCA